MADTSYKFGLEDCKIAVWSASGSYGTLVDVPSIQLMGLELETTNAKLQGDDQTTDVHARHVGGQVRIRFGFKSLDVIAVLTGLSVVSSTAGQKSMVFTNFNSPYFGIIGKVDDTAGGGNDLLFVPKVKIMQGFGLSMEYGRYMTPEIQAECVPDSIWGIAKLVQYTSSTAIATAGMPPL